MTRIVFCFFLILCHCNISNGASNIILSTSLGSVIGTVEENRNGFISIFRGIPYTEYAPVGDHRFRESIVRNSSYENNILNATSYGAACIPSIDNISIVEDTIDSSLTSEDCLTLNIFTPNINISDANNASIRNNSSLLPVILLIHGGGFVTGSSSDEGLENAPYAFIKGDETNDMIYVSINYRLGAFGFVALESILNETNNRTTGGMNGIYDQIVALQWIQKYIIEFGGDPNRVTLLGSSAGSVAICILMISDLANGLFDQVILQSGSCIGSWQCMSYQHGLNMNRIALKNANLSDNLNELRQLNTTQIVYSFSSVSSFLNMFPCVVDGNVINDLPSNIYYNKIATNNKQINGNKILTGSVSLDSVFAFPFFFSGSQIKQAPINENELRYYLKSYIDNESQIDSMINYHYNIDDFIEYNYFGEIFSKYEMLWYSMNADVCVICPTFKMTDLLQFNDNITNNVYLYHFIGPQDPYYVPHGGDGAFIFNNSDVAFLFGLTWDSSLSNFMISAWRDYILYGNSWIPYGINQTTMIFSDDNGYIQQKYNTKYRKNVCNFWIDEIGWNSVINLCGQTLPVSIPTDTDDQVEIWIIISGIVAGIIVLILLVIVSKKYCVNKLNNNKEYYEMTKKIENNDNNKYGAVSTQENE